MSKELFDIIAKTGNATIERIISRGHKSPPGFWYDQDFDEWVVVLRGAAKLRLAGQKKIILMKAGDYLLIPARKRHRVEWTPPDKQTIWLAVKIGR